MCVVTCRRRVGEENALEREREKNANNTNTNTNTNNDKRIACSFCTYSGRGFGRCSWSSAFVDLMSWFTMARFMEAS